MLERLAELPYRRLLDFEELAEVLGYPRDTNPLDVSVAPRGYRVLRSIPRLPESVIRHVVRDFGSLDAIIRASHRDLEAVDGVGPCGRGRSGRAYAACRSTISSTVTCSFQSLLWG